MAIQLQACFNRDASTQEPYFVEDFVTGRPSKLNIRSVWWSTKLAPAEEPAAASSGNDALPANPLTVVTMATLHRLSNLEAQCNSWPGPLTAAVYVPLLLGNDTGNSAILKEAQAAARKLYDSASEVMQLCREGNLLILPAFEICPDRTYQLQTGKQVADAAAKGGKAKLVKLVKEEKMCSFHAVYPEGHGPTQYPTWYKSTWPYKITHKPLFEPWFIVDRRLNPWYDARFRGYGYNKQEQVTAAAHAYNLTFLVHPAAYVVHRPHET
ncbi:glycosyltransferase-like protein LARGE2, partial [Haematococcus lacustris]